MLAATVFDSDSAHLVFCDRTAGTWEACLAAEQLVWHFLGGVVPYEVLAEFQPMSAGEYEDYARERDDEMNRAINGLTSRLVTGDAVGARAHQWAVDAGLRPDSADALSGAVNEPSEPFAEDAVDGLVHALGLRSPR
ncbi:hypothetical protein [Antribacter gilvus]|uniref:hypothetical protein n=1 Tax=Antribacter gilvus TaxID=2304675 RepID=UPI0013E0773F|nr:hypothetical protein [Antribacter gilvus]